MENAYKNRNYEKIFVLSRCFYYSTCLPISVYEKRKCVLKLPEHSNSGVELLNDSTLYPSINDDFEGIQTFTNKILEVYFLVHTIDDFYLVIGPFLNTKIEEGKLSYLIRDSIIPFHQKTNMQKYYNSCTILDEKRLFYIAKLIENMFIKKDILEDNISIDENDEIDSNDFYLKQKDEYRKTAFIHSPYAIEQEITKTISNGDIRASKQLLQEINLTPHAKLASSTIRSYKNSMICSCAFMTRAAISGGVNPDEAFTLSDMYINKIEDLTSIKELENFESIMIDGFTSKVQEVKTKSYSPAVLQSINYIDKHLSEDIKIDAIAKEVYLNPSYLSTLFHKETGKTLTDWILKEKIEESARFILNSNNSIADIAFFYHFSSQSYFVQCFKKYMGITPGEYRKQKVKQVNQ